MVWVDYILEDGRIIPEHKLVMCPESQAWRDPDTVSEAERKFWADRIRSRLKTGRNLMEDEAGWAEFCHYVMYTIVCVRKEADWGLSGWESNDPTTCRPV